MLIVSTSASIITLTVNELKSLINSESPNGLKKKKTQLFAVRLTLCLKVHTGGKLRTGEGYSRTM